MFQEITLTNDNIINFNDIKALINEDFSLNFKFEEEPELPKNLLNKLKENCEKSNDYTFYFNEDKLISFLKDISIIVWIDKNNILYNKF